MMSDDFSVFWRNNERASALFYDLLARSEQDAYDDDFLAARGRDYTLCLETPNVASVSGTIDLQYAKAEIYPRAHEKEAGYEIDDPALRAFFYPRAQDFLRGIASNGEAFSPLKES